MNSITKTQLLGRLTILIILFFGIGQYLFGCGPTTAQLKAWSEVERTTAIQQGLTDRELIRTGNQQGGGDAIGKITLLPAPEELPTITTTTAIPRQQQYVDELGEIHTENKTVTETRVDTTALAIQQLGGVALALAQRTGTPMPPQTENESEPVGTVYLRHPMPTDSTADVIKNVGIALNESGIVTGAVSGFLGYVAGKTIQTVAKVPSHTGDYVQVRDSQNMDSNNRDSQNPTTTTTTGRTE